MWNENDQVHLITACSIDFIDCGTSLAIFMRQSMLAVCILDRTWREKTTTTAIVPEQTTTVIAKWKITQCTDINRPLYFVSMPNRELCELIADRWCFEIHSQNKNNLKYPMKREAHENDWPLISEWRLSAVLTCSAFASWSNTIASIPNKIRRYAW